MTCNANWPEIQNNLQPGQTASDRPDLVARVFKLKLNKLIEDITKRYILGKILAFSYTIEFQKRGLPHFHMLVILDQEDRPNNPGKIDELVCAEIPNQLNYPELYEIIKKCMAYGPCGEMNPNSVCMENGTCKKKKKIPKDFGMATRINGNGYPSYRRVPGPTIQIGNNQVDNRFVVPYNKFLCKKYNCHINIEICTSIASVKYIFKYVYKGYDSIHVAIAENQMGQEIIYDEVQQHLNARYVSAPEGMWRLLEFKIHDRSRSKIRMPVHLEHQQPVYFQPGEERQALERDQQRNTQLTAWIILNQTDVNARNLHYTEIPYHYVFNKQTTLWQPRQRSADKIISRMYTVSPKDVERFCLRILLLHVKGEFSLFTIERNKWNRISHIQRSSNASKLATR
ncbi:uncharacterized protein LOC143026761 [Oratosquilla oratoria]|uniref:uncharacterized protein LOC143026761 n=1 Tax=Oratosquilla oratoria TaxID=337810 RepID=UPI003F75E84E